MIIWITGLPGSGKTSLSNAIVNGLSKDGIACVQLDGDQLRSILPFKIGYSIEERRKISMFYAKLAVQIEGPNTLVVCSFVSLFHPVRCHVRDNSTRYLEVYINPPLSALNDYNKKSLYTSNDSHSVPSQLSEYDFPTTPDIIIPEVVDDSNQYHYFNEFRNLWFCPDK